MKVSPWDVIVRGLLHRCPNCGGNSVFRGLFKTNKNCARCGMPIEREEGFFLGAMAINYAIVALPVIPLLVLVFMERIGQVQGIIAFGVWAVLAPILFYRSSKSLWLTLYYLALPKELPANQAVRPERRV